MRIVIPTVDYPPIEGGIGSVALHLSRALAQRGHEVTVVAPLLSPKNPQYADMRAFDAAEPLRVVRFSGYDWGWFRCLPLLLKTWPFLKESDCLLGINIAYGGFIGRLAQVRFGLPYITFAYAYEFLKFKRNPLLARSLLHLYRRAHKTIAISHYTKARLMDFGLSEQDIAVIHPGSPQAQPVAQETLAALEARFELGENPLLLAVGRFIPRKGQLTLIQAMPAILDRHPRTQAVLVGRGPLHQACLDKVRALELEAHIHCPGYVDEKDLAALYERCSLFILPTGEDAGGQVEGFGLVFSEAHAYGKAVVAGRSGGVVDAVLEGETGLIVDPDSPDAVAQAVVRLLDHPAQAQVMGAQGKQRIAEELNWRVFADRLLGVIEAGGGAP